MATKAALLAEVTTNFPDNVTGLITPAIQRTTHNDEINSWQQAPGLNYQIVTSYTFTAADYGQMVAFSNASPTAATLPTPGTTGFTPFNVLVKNIGAGTVTVTPVIPSTIDGVASITVTSGQTTWIISDGTNYRTAINTSSVVLSVGGTSVSGGTSGNFFYNNAGVFGERTPTQATAALNTFTSALQGLAPASGGGSTNFLRADGAWAIPPIFTSGSAGYVPASGGGTTNFLNANGSWTNPPGGPGGPFTSLQFNNSGVLLGDTGFTYAGQGQVSINLGVPGSTAAQPNALAINFGSNLFNNAYALNITGSWNSTAVATTGASGTGTVATITTAGTSYAVGSVVYVQGVTPSGYNGSYVVTAQTSNSVSFNNTTTGAQTVAGTIQQEFHSCVINPTLFAGAQFSSALDVQISGVTKFSVFQFGAAVTGGLQLSGTAGLNVFADITTNLSDFNETCVLLNTGAVGGIMRLGFTDATDGGGSVCQIDGVSVSRGGSLRFRTRAPSYGAYTDWMRLDSGGHFNLWNGCVLRSYNSVDNVEVPVNYERGFIQWVSNTLRIGTQSGGTGVARNVAFLAGTSTITYTANGGLQIGAPTGGDKGAGTVNATGLYVNGTAVGTGGTPGGSSGQLEYNNAGAFGGAGLWRNSANQITQSNGVTAQSFIVYNTTDTDGGTPTNYERGVFDWTTTANVLTIGTQRGGTGAIRNLQFQVGGTDWLDYGVTRAGLWNFLANATTSVATLQNSLSTGYSAFDVYNNLGSQKSGFGYANASAGNTTLQGYGYFWCATGTDFVINPGGFCMHFFSGTSTPANLAETSSGAAATGHRIYNTTDSNQGTPVNYERCVLDWTVTANVFTIGPQAGGTGTLRYMKQTVAFAAPAPAAPKTANYSHLVSDQWIIFNGAGSLTLTLLSAATYPGLSLFVLTLAAFTVVSASSNVLPRTSTTAGTAILPATAGAWVQLVSNGTNWQITAGTP